MRLFTVRLKSNPTRGFVVLAVRNDGALLLADDADEMQWVNAEDVLIGALYRDPLETAWWQAMASGHED